MTLLFNSTFRSLLHSASSQETRETARQPVSCWTSSIRQVPPTPFKLYAVRSSFNSLTLPLPLPLVVLHHYNATLQTQLPSAY